MKSLNDCYELSNGLEIPCVGYGAWSNEDEEIVIPRFASVIEAGYRLIDTALGYSNEKSVGAAIKKSGIPRDQFFITSKISDGGYERTIASLEESMANLGVDYVELYLIHWPNDSDSQDEWQKINAGTWKALEEFYEAKKIGAIGISNFYLRHIETLLKTAKISPMVNQLRLCPGDTKDELVDFCRSHNMLLQAYSPLGAGRIFEVPEMKKLADKYGKSISQICMRWSLQMGYNPLPRTASTERMKENIDIFDFELLESDVQLITDLKGCVGYSTRTDPSWA